MTLSPAKWPKRGENNTIADKCQHILLVQQCSVFGFTALLLIYIIMDIAKMADLLDLKKAEKVCLQGSCDKNSSRAWRGLTGNNGQLARASIRIKLRLMGDGKIVLGIRCKEINDSGMVPEAARHKLLLWATRNRLLSCVVATMLQEGCMFRCPLLTPFCLVYLPL